MRGSHDLINRRNSPLALSSSGRVGRRESCALHARTVSRKLSCSRLESTPAGRAAMGDVLRHGVRRVVVSRSFVRRSRSRGASYFREETFSEVASWRGFRERASAAIADPRIRFREHERQPRGAAQGEGAGTCSARSWLRDDPRAERCGFENRGRAASLPAGRDGRGAASDGCRAAVARKRRNPGGVSSRVRADSRVQPQAELLC